MEEGRSDCGRDFHILHHTVFSKDGLTKIYVIPRGAFAVWHWHISVKRCRYCVPLKLSQPIAFGGDDAMWPSQLAAGSQSQGGFFLLFTVSVSLCVCFSFSLGHLGSLNSNESQELQGASQRKSAGREEMVTVEGASKGSLKWTLCCLSSAVHDGNWTTNYVSVLYKTAKLIPRNYM